MSKYIFNNDTDILEFLEQLRENGIQIWGEGEKIRYRSKNRQLAPETLRILKMAKGQILDFFRMIEKNVIPLTSIQTAYVVGQTAGCELGNINAHYYIEYTIESLDVERLEQMINLVISKNDALRLIVTHEGKASFLDNVPYYSVPVYSLYDGNDREQKRLERSHHRYNYYKWPMFHFCVGKTSGKTSVLHVDFDCIILDAWSAKLLLNEIFSLYYGKDVKFPRISFMNYMRLKTDKGDLEAEEYWKEKVKNMPSFPKLNYQKKFAEVQNVRFDRIECDFSFIETQRLYQKIKNYHFTPAAVISTIFMKTLAQYSETPGLAFYLGEYIAESEIEDYLKIHLPEYSIPNSINRLENFPLNANGKVDRRRLAEYQKTDSVEIMSDKVLNIVLMIWEELLKNKVADLDENLFKIGADSLLAARFVAAINARCGIEVRMKEVFMNPSINALTKLVDKRKNTDIAEFVEEGEI